MFGRYTTAIVCNIGITLVGKAKRTLIRAIGIRGRGEKERTRFSEVG